MDRQRFLRELEDIKAGLDSRNNQSVCNRIYTALVDCLTAESKSVEAKLQVLTAALSYYTDLRPSHDATAAEADALGHYLFMECSRVVLGIEFHHLANDDPHKVALKETIVAAREQLASYTICHVFHILDWLLVNQWSHPTLVAMMRGEDVDRDSALAYVTTGEYPELLRLRIQMLMESGCEAYSLNLISWCVRSPVFESDVAMRATYLLLLHRLGRTDDFHNQCCQIRCCVACDLLRHLASRGSVEDQSFLLLLSQTFLLVNWVKPVQACCIQELLEFWLRIQRSNEPDLQRFQDSVRKVAVLTQDLKNISVFLDVLVSEFAEEVMSLCTELAVSVFRRELNHVCQRSTGGPTNHLHNLSCRHYADLDTDVAASLAQICRAVGRLYLRHPHMRLASQLTSFSLLPTDTQFYDVEESCRILPPISSDEPILSSEVDRHLYTSLLDLLSCVRSPELDPQVGWENGLKLAVVRRLEETAGLRYDVMTNSFVPTAESKLVDMRLGRTVKGTSGAAATAVTGDDGKRELNRAPNAGGFTLDDIQQVLSAANCPMPSMLSQSTVSVAGAGGGDTSVDERALKEITAYLQSEIGSHRVGLHGDVSGRSVGVAMAGSDSSMCGGYNNASNNHSGDSGVLVRLIPPSQAAGTSESSRGSAETHDEGRGTDGGASGTILVTDSNLPYLQQFLPNLQTVMQSVQSLVRCVPGSMDHAANSQQPRSMSLPSLGTSRNAPELEFTTTPSSGGHKKRKRSGHSAKSENSTAANSSFKDFSVPSTMTSKSGIGVGRDFASHQGKVEPDTSASSGDSFVGFTCGQCSRTFSKRLGLSVHIQRAHGHRRSSESTDASGASAQDSSMQFDKPTTSTPKAKNCFVKMPAATGGCPPVASCDSRDPLPMQSGAVCMCDGCGELVSGLEAHSAVCVGRQSPVMKAAANGIGVGNSVVIPAVAESVPPAVSTNTAVVEMLQLAEHFLRQHVPGATSATLPGADQLHMMSSQAPVPYADEGTTTSTHMLATGLPPRVPALGVPTELPTVSSGIAPEYPTTTSQPTGKEIVFEGSRMREFVEYQCEACLLTFSSSALANSHLADHHTSASLSAYRVYACLACSLRYRDPRIMRHHVVYLCGGGRSAAQTDGTGLTKQQSQQQLFPCSFCPKTFMSTEYVQLHVRLRHSGGGSQPGALASTVGPSPVQCVLPTPSGATSVPSLEQLVSNFRRPTVNQAATSTNSVIVGQEVDHQTNKAAPVLSPVMSPEVDGGGKPSSQAVVDGRQLNPESGVKSRSSKAKGILYKNVFMQCEGTYYCSVCQADLTGRESKRRHRQLPCGDPKTASYSRRYSYVCPYCSERFPSQKLCRQHQIDECLPLIGVGTAELGVSEARCPLCPKTCFGFPALKGHVMQAHHMPKDDAAKLLAEHGVGPTTALAIDRSSVEHGVLGGTGLAMDRAVEHGGLGGTVLSSEEFNGVLSPTISSPSSTTSAAFVTQTRPSPASCSLYDSAVSVSHGDGLDSDEDIPEPDQQPKELFPQLYESVVSDDGSGHFQPSMEDVSRPKRNRKSRSSSNGEFFVMMFRNYPILAKGVSMCRSCATKLEPTATSESHAVSCTGTSPADVRRSTLFRCTHCPATFWRAKDCRTHQLESCLPAHGVKIERLSEPSVACPMCEVRSYNRSGLMSHMKFRHSLDTDGVRAVMDRCGIRKSVPPSADDIVTSPTAGESPDFEDGSMDIGIQDGVLAEIDTTTTPLSVSNATDVLDRPGHCAATAADMLVDGLHSDLPTISGSDPADDAAMIVANDTVSTWRTANLVLQQRSSADVNN